MNGFAVQLVAKGKANPEIARNLMSFLQECGLHGTVCIRTDPESVVRSYAQQLAKLRGGETTILEATVKRSWPSIGSVDYFAQEVLGMVRVYCEVVHTNWQKQILNRINISTIKNTSANY